ncbi:glycosyltransferase family 2 protein [Streptomyces sp. NPDC002577]
MTTPDVTVTVIVYNDAERLPRAVASVRAQTHRNIEIVISDDHSTDDTPDVARALAAKDDRITYLRLEENSGGCSAPRNRAIDIARAPRLMFLDSDDELPPDACALLLAAHREREIDFAMGAVERIRVDTGRRGLWMPHLVGRRRTVPGIEAEPGLLFEHLSTSKMYRKDFLDRHGMRFPEGIHYEDQLFSAQAYTLARAFTIITEPVYRWYIDPRAAASSASISNQRHRIGNVRDRVKAARLVDAFLAEHGGSERLKEEKEYKFLKHDFRMYLMDLPHREPEWIAEFAAETVPYLQRLSPRAFARLPRAERVVAGLLCDGRYEEAREAARDVAHRVAPREIVTDQDGHAYWGGVLPSSGTARRELDVSGLHPGTCPFPGALFRHEIVRITRGPGASVDLDVRTYDPARRLPLAPQVASVHLSPAGRRTTARFRMDLVRPGVFEGSVRLDLARASLPVWGFQGVRHPVLELTDRTLGNTGVLLAPLDLPSLELQGPGGHHITVEPEGCNAGRLQLRWRPGTARRLLRPIAQRAAKRVRALTG